MAPLIPKSHSCSRRILWAIEAKTAERSRNIRVERRKQLSTKNKLEFFLPICPLNFLIFSRALYALFILRTFLLHMMSKGLYKPYTVCISKQIGSGSYILGQTMALRTIGEKSEVEQIINEFLAEVE